MDAQEAHVLAGVVEASDYGLIEPVLLGPRAQIEAVCRQLDCPVDRFPILDMGPASQAAEAGVQLVLEGKASALVKGWIHTDELMRPVLRQLRTTRRVSHVFIADLPVTTSSCSSPTPPLILRRISPPRRRSCKTRSIWCAFWV